MKQLIGTACNHLAIPCDDDGVFSIVPAVEVVLMFREVAGREPGESLESHDDLETVKFLATQDGLANLIRDLLGMMLAADDIADRMRESGVKVPGDDFNKLLSGIIESFAGDDEPEPREAAKEPAS